MAARFTSKFPSEVFNVRYQKHEICAIPLVNTVGGFLSSYIDGYTNDPLEIKLVVCGDNFEIKDMRTPFSVIHGFGSVLCVNECIFINTWHAQR